MLPAPTLTISLNSKLATQNLLSAKQKLTLLLFFMPENRFHLQILDRQISEILIGLYEKKESKNMNGLLWTFFLG